MSSHTPGPWKIVPDEDDEGFASPWGRVEVAPFRWIRAEGRDGEEALANIHLIAVGPEMLVELDQTIADMRSLASVTDDATVREIAHQVADRHAAIIARAKVNA